MICSYRVVLRVATERVKKNTKIWNIGAVSHKTERGEQLFSHWAIDRYYMHMMQLLHINNVVSLFLSKFCPSAIYALIFGLDKKKMECLGVNFVNLFQMLIQ